MNEQFISIIQKVISDHSKSILNNRVVFNSFLADYAKGEFMHERRLFIRELKTSSFDEVMKKYQPLLPKPASPQPVPKPPAPRSTPQSAPVPSAPVASQINCFNCGSLIPQDAAFCSKCGAKVSTEEDSECDELEKRDRCIKKGFKNLNIGNIEKAVKNFLKANSISYTGDAYFGLACCHSQLKNYNEAIGLFEEAKEFFEKEGGRDGIRACNNAIREINDTIKQRKESIDGLIDIGATIIAKLLS